MTPQEIEANQAAILAALAEHGVTPEAALAEEGRQKAMSRMQGTYAKAKERGYEGLAKRLEGMAETEGRAYAGRQSRRGRGGTGSAPSAPLPPPEQMLGTFMPVPAATPTPAPAPSPAQPDNMLAQYAPSRMPLSNFQMRGFNPRPGNMQTPDTLTGEETAPLPSPASLTMTEVSRVLAPILGDQYARPGDYMYGRPLLPMNDLERADDQDRMRTLGAIYKGVPAAGLAVLAPEARAAEVGVRGAQALARSPLGQWAGRNVVEPALGLVARNPLMAGGLAAGGMTIATPGETQGTDPLQRLGETKTKLEATRDTLAAELKALDDLAKKPSKKAVQDLQRSLGLKVDGVWGGATTAAFDAQKKAKEQAQRENRADLLKIDTDIRNETRAQRRQEAVSRMLPWERFVVERPGLVNTAALIGGGTLPTLMRTAGAAGKAAMTRWNRNRMIPGERAPTEARVAGTNRFYSEGGGQEPFRIDATAPQGFVPAARQQSASNLFPDPARPGFGGADAALATVPAGITARAGYGYFGESKPELEAARQAADENPSQENMNRLAQAEYRANMQGATLMGASGATIGAVAYPFMRPQFSTRPNVQRAGAEVQRLNALLKQKGGGNQGNGPWPSLKVRQRDKTFSLPANAPIHPHDVPAPSTGLTGEVWASPAGQKIVKKRANGTWSEPGVKGSATPPQKRKGWRRIAEVEEPNYLADYAMVG